MFLEKFSNKFDKRMIGFELALADTMSSISQMSGVKRQDNYDDVIQSSGIKQIIGFTSNEEIEKIAADESKINSIVKYINENVIKSKHFHIDVHKKLLSEPLLGRSFLSHAE